MNNIFPNFIYFIHHFPCRSLSLPGTPSLPHHPHGATLNETDSDEQVDSKGDRVLGYDKKTRHGYIRTCVEKAKG